MKFASALVALSALSIAPLASAGPVGLIDDFSDTSLAEYTQTAVLDQGATRNVAFSSPSGALQAVSSGSDGAEQVLLLRPDFTLGVGEVLRADTNFTLANQSQDLAIAVSATATPTINNISGSDRKDYFFSGVRSTPGHYVASGFDGAAGTTGLTTLQDQTNNTLAIESVFIKRLTSTDFTVGFVRGGTETTVGTYSVTNTNIGNAVGFYTDMRASGTISPIDNLRIEFIPEPASLGLVMLGGLMLRRRRVG